MNQNYFFIRIEGQDKFRKATHSASMIGGYKLLDCTHPLQNTFIGFDQVIEKKSRTEFEGGLNNGN